MKFPDWDKKKQILYAESVPSITSVTIEEDGYISAFVYGEYVSGYIYVNDTIICNGGNYKSSDVDSNFCPVKKGDIVKFVITTAGHVWGNVYYIPFK